MTDRYERLRYLSVCSGIEAASVAWGPLGWQAVAFSEIEPFPCAVLAHHYPDVPNLGDMTMIAQRILNGDVEAPDVLAGGTPCFTAGHMVFTQRGYVPIEEIVVGDMVVTHKGRLRRVVRIGSKIARVGRLSGVGLGEKISCTPDHPFRSVEWRMQNTKRGNKYERVEHIGDPSWTAAKDMPGSQWCALTAVSVDAPVMPDGIDADELLYIAGFYLGDGFIRRWADVNKKAVVFGVNDEKVDRFKARVTKSVSVLRERTGPRIVLGNTAIADWLIENFGEYSHAKTLPAWVLAHPQRAALMDGYLDTDGHRTANGWRAISVSRALAYGMRDLAQTLGMVASVAFTKVEPTKTIEGRKVNQRDYWTVTAFNGETSRKSRIRHGMLLRTVSAFEEVGDETVFNIEVDEDHSYVLDGVIVHNCQAFSVAGLRKSLADERGNPTLKFVEIADAIDFVRVRDGRPPAIVFWENVPGVLSTKDNAFGCFLGALAGEDCELKPPGKRWADAGCVLGPQRAIAWRVLDAQYFGLAQRRRRVFVVASARDGFDPAAVLFEFECVRRDTPPCRESRQTAPTIPARSSGGGGLGTDFDCDGGTICVATGQAGAEICADMEPTLNCNHEAPYVVHTLRGEGFDASEDGTGRGTPLVPHVVGALACNTGPNGHDAGNFAFNQAVDAGHVLPVVFLPTQDLISSTDGSTHALGCGSTGGQASVAVAVALRGREGGAAAELGDEVQNCLRASSGGGDKPYVLVNQSQIGGRQHANAEKTRPIEALRILREAIGEEAFCVWSIGILAALQPAQVLQSRLHGTGFRCATFSRNWVVYCALSRQEDSSAWLLQSLRETECEGCPPQGWEPSEQLTRELGAYLSELSQPGAQAARFVRDLREASEGSGLLRQALSAVQEVGRSSGSETQSAHRTYAVRRLTVEECEFLQGFPRGYTRIPWRGKPADQCPDGPRYKALGNSWAVPVVRWIGERINAAVEQIKHERRQHD